MVAQQLLGGKAFAVGSYTQKQKQSAGRAVKQVGQQAKKAGQAVKKAAPRPVQRRTPPGEGTLPLLAGANTLTAASSDW